MKPRDLQLALVDFALSAAGLTCLGLGIYFMFNKELSLALAALGGGLVLLFSATIYRFEYVKGLGIEAKTRQLDATIDKAELAIEQIKALAELTGGTLLSLTSDVGKWGRWTGIDDAHALSRRVLSVLRSLNSSEDTIRDALRPWARVAAMTLFEYEVIQMHRLIQAKIAEKDRSQISKADQDKIALELQTVQGHAGKFSQGMRAWKLDEFAKKTLEMFDTAPLLDDATRSQRRSEFVRAAAEFSFLESQLDISDRELWQRVTLMG